MERAISRTSHSTSEHLPVPPAGSEAGSSSQGVMSPGDQQGSCRDVGPRPRAPHQEPAAMRSGAGCRLATCDGVQAGNHLHVDYDGFVFFHQGSTSCFALCYSSGFDLLQPGILIVNHIILYSLLSFIFLYNDAAECCTM